MSFGETGQTEKTGLVPKIDYNDYNVYIDYNDYNDYNDYRDREWDLDWKQFSDLVTQLTITDKLWSLNHDIEG